jgi:hypothetical protein
VVMTGVRSPRSADVEVVLGVDTHLEFHVAVALDNLGRRLVHIQSTSWGMDRCSS